ncbi:hypothetical protein DRN86_02280 [Candidatus Geothermarchaeota archaeon]|nr:MAG: hypothetical protein DRN86_02280 [Candidatus Geothermarchaeota archaeon]
MNKTIQDRVVALILCGGFGTRLRPLTCYRPKPLIPFLNEPLLLRIINRLKSHGIKDIVLAVGFWSEVIERKIKKWSLDVNIMLSEEDRPLGTGGAIKNASRYLDEYDRFLVLNTDVVCEVDFGDVYRQHEKGEALATVVLKEVEDVSGFGVAAVKGRKIELFIEKPKPEQAPSRWANAGIYIFEKEILDIIPEEKREISLEREIFPIIVKMQRMEAYFYRDIWFDIGTIKNYMTATQEYLKKYEAEGKIILPKNLISGKTRLNKPVLMDEGIKSGDEVILGPFVVIGKDVKVGENTVIKKSIIFDGARIGSSCEIQDSVIASNCEIGDGSIIRNSTIADWVRIGDGVKILGSVVFPGKKVNKNLSNGTICY